MELVNSVQDSSTIILLIKLATIVLEVAKFVNWLKNVLFVKISINLSLITSIPNADKSVEMELLYNCHAIYQKELMMVAPIHVISNQILHAATYLQQLHLKTAPISVSTLVLVLILVLSKYR